MVALEGELKVWNDLGESSHVGIRDCAIFVLRIGGIGEPKWQPGRGRCEFWEGGQVRCH